MALIAAVAFSSQGCDEPTTPPREDVPVEDVEPDVGPEVITGTVTLRVDQGVVFASGEIIRGAYIDECDIMATPAGGYLRLTSCGPKSVDTEAVYWYEELASLAEVPTGVVPEGEGHAIPEARVGTGFVVVNYTSGGVTRGFVSAIEKDLAVIEYELTR